MENFKNKDLYGSKCRIILVEQSRRFYPLYYTKNIYLRFNSFGHLNAQKYSIFRFNLFQSKELTDFFIIDNFLIKNIEFTRYFWFCKRIKSVYLKKLMRAIIFGTSSKVRLNFFIRSTMHWNKQKKFRIKRWRIFKKRNFRTYKRSKKPIKLKRRMRKRIRSKQVGIFSLAAKKTPTFLPIAYKLRETSVLKARKKIRKKVLSQFFFRHRKRKYYFKVKVKSDHFDNQWKYRKAKKNYSVATRLKRYTRSHRGSVLPDFVSPIFGSLRRTPKKFADLYRIDWKAIRKLKLRLWGKSKPKYKKNAKKVRQKKLF